MSSQGREPRSAHYELIAHRAGNDVDLLKAAREIADVIEVDVHLRRGRLEVRHAKLLRPTSRLWEKWYLLPRDHRVPVLEEILDAAGPDVHLWLDLKGIDPRLAAAALPLVADRPSVTVSSKSWWILHRFRATSARRFRSAGNRFELLLLRHLPSRVTPEGVVLHERLLDRTTIDRLQRKSRLVFSWGATNPARVNELIDAGVGGVIIDEHALIARLQRERDDG